MAELGNGWRPRATSAGIRAAASGEARSDSSIDIVSASPITKRKARDLPTTMTRSDRFPRGEPRKTVSATRRARTRSACPPSAASRGHSAPRPTIGATPRYRGLDRPDANHDHEQNCEERFDRGLECHLDYLNDATSAESESPTDRLPSSRGVQCSTTFSRQPAPHRLVYRSAPAYGE